jgi:hypothetical protein
MRATIIINLDSGSMKEARFKEVVSAFVAQVEKKRLKFGLRYSGLNISVVADEKVDLMEANCE